MSADQQIFSVHSFNLLKAPALARHTVYFIATWQLMSAHISRLPPSLPPLYIKSRTLQPNQQTKTLTSSMEAASSWSQVCWNQTSGSPNKIKNWTVTLRPSTVLNLGWQPPKMALAILCVAPRRGSVRDVEEEIAVEREEMEKWVEKCRGQGLMELLECLEREAIMGDDEGKDPRDYNRRARIFDKSSRVFGPLQQTEAVPSPEPSS